MKRKLLALLGWQLRRIFDLLRPDERGLAADYLPAVC